MHLHREPFAEILSGVKAIEVRLNDEKRQTIKVGDQIIFTSRSKHSATILVKVTRLLYLDSFLEMFRTLNPDDSDEKLSEQLMSMYQYYSPDDEKKFGVVGISFTVS